MVIANAKAIRAETWVGHVEVIKPNEILLMEDHLLRLSPDVLRARFGAEVTAEFLSAYVLTALNRRTVLFACKVGGAARGIAELRRFSSDGRSAEAAFSVESDWQGQGIGTSLMIALVGVAGLMGIDKIFICCERKNRCMQHITEAVGGILEFSEGTCLGSIRVTEMPLQCAFSTHSNFKAVVIDIG